MKTVTNPWFREFNAYSRPQFTYHGASLFEYRGVEVYKNPAGSWDYILGDTAITQRAGFDRAKAPEVIDRILNGIDYVADAVCAHLRAKGFTKAQPYP